MTDPTLAPILTGADRDLLGTSRTATLATLGPNRRPRLVPCCYAADPAIDRLWTPIDQKPKRWADPRRLGRVVDLAARPVVSLLVERWSEDWSKLAWLRLHGTAVLLEPDDSDPTTLDERRLAIDLLRRRYPQYRNHDLEARPVIAIEVTAAVRWSAGDG
ncbi:MAG: pyridoxamine 5'-phosphate oxidase family protein [Candidatus Limnocylindrales bacterium]